MTQKELNRDIRRMWFEYIQTEDDLNTHEINMKQYDERIENKIRPEFHRLIYADDSFKSANRKSILILIILNRKFGFLKQFRFGLNIDEEQI